VFSHGLTPEIPERVNDEAYELIEIKELRNELRLMKLLLRQVRNICCALRAEN